VVNIYSPIKEIGTTIEMIGRMTMKGIPTGTNQKGPTSMGLHGRMTMIGLTGKNIIKSIRKVVDTSATSIIIINEKIMINTMMMMMKDTIVVNATRMIIIITGGITWMIISYTMMTTAPEVSMGKKMVRRETRRRA